MDVREEEVSRVTDDAHIVLDVERELEVVAPVPPLAAIWRQDGIVEENLQPVEIRTQAIEDNDVRRDDEEVPRKHRVRFVELVEETPGDEQREDFRLARAGRHFQDVPRPVLREHAAGNCPGGIETEKVKLVPRPADLMEPDDRLHRLALGEIVAEGGKRTVRILEQVVALEPVMQQRKRCRRCAGVSPVAPRVDFLSDLCHERRHQLLIGRAAHLLGSGKPSLLRYQRSIRRRGKLGVECHLVLRLGHEVDGRVL